MIKRYDFEPSEIWATECGKGAYVTYADYEALEVKYINLCQTVEEAQRALNMALPDEEDC